MALKLTGTLVPDELILEVLSRTPVKDLIRLRCVSKSWLALTVDPHFISMHLNRNVSNNKGILCRGLASQYPAVIMSLLRVNEPPVTLFKLEFKPNRPRKFDDATRFDFFKSFSRMDFCGSIDGIVCLSHCWKDPDPENLVECEQFAVLWNPAINRYKPILLPTNETFQMVGLGFDADAKDYKIIRIVPIVLGPSFVGLSKVDIYSSNQDSWNNRVLVPFPRSPNCRSPNCNIIVKGVPYWVDVDGENLVAIDPCTGKHRIVPYPIYEKNQSTSVHPINLMDSVALLIYSPGMNLNHLVDVYVLDESCGDWIRKHTTQPIVAQGLWLPKCLTNGELVVQTWEGPGTCRFSAKFDLQCYSHVESLVCLEGMQPLIEDKKKKKKSKKKNWVSKRCCIFP